jgi:hypothetical protein
MDMKKAVNHGEHGGHGEKQWLALFFANQPAAE